MALEAHDRSLHDLVVADAPIERIAGGLWFTEGPVWRGDELLFSDIPNKRIARWRRLPEGPELTTCARGTSNGLTLDRQGRVLAAEHDGRRVSRVGDDGTRTVLAERYEGKRLNSPNDIVVRDRQGNVFCTGPGGVWVCRPDGALLGRVILPELPANLAWGEDGTVLFLTARTSVYRLATKTQGAVGR
jgi:gluconolactonase